MVPRLSDFRTKFPDIAVYLDTNDDVIDLDNSEVDVALRFGVPDWEDLYCELLTREELIVVASPSLVTGKTSPMSADSIAHLPLLHDKFNPAWDEWADLVGLDSSKVSQAEVKFMDSAVLITAVIDGQGVALARRLLLEDDLKAGRVTRLDDTAISLDSSLYLVCRDGEQDIEPIRSLKEWLFAQLTSALST